MTRRISRSPRRTVWPVYVGGIARLGRREPAAGRHLLFHAPAVSLDAAAKPDARGRAGRVLHRRGAVDGPTERAIEPGDVSADRAGGDAGDRPLVAMAFPSPWVVTPLLLIYVMLSTSGWPALESLASDGVSGPCAGAAAGNVQPGVVGHARRHAGAERHRHRTLAGGGVRAGGRYRMRSAVVTVWFGDFGRSALAPSLGTAGEGRGEGDFSNVETAPDQRKSPSTPTL